MSISKKEEEEWLEVAEEPNLCANCMRGVPLYRVFHSLSDSNGEVDTTVYNDDYTGFCKRCLSEGELDGIKILKKSEL